jgi:hypothetical protein
MASKSCAWLAVLVATVTACFDDGTCPASSRIMSTTFAREGTTLSWTLEVESLPDAIMIDRPDVKNTLLEYHWGVSLDSTRDGRPDLEVSLSHFKLGDRPRRVARAEIPERLQASVWRVDASGGSLIGPADVRLDSNTFLLSVMESIAPELVNVTEESQVTWRTHIASGDGGESCTDSVNGQ